MRTDYSTKDADPKVGRNKRLYMGIDNGPHGASLIPQRSIQKGVSVVYIMDNSIEYSLSHWFYLHSTLLSIILLDHIFDLFIFILLEKRLGDLLYLYP